MSILIKGMEMPVTGGFITLQICGDGTVRIVNKATGGVYIAPAFEEANGTDERIRASSVPTPHGRLIDADALITTFCEWGTRLERGRKLVITMCEAKQAIVDIIEDAPTVIEAEEDKA